MVNIRRQLMGLGFIAASSITAMSAAHALTGQTNIKIDGGPLGELEMSGGMAGYGYFLDNDGTNGTAYHQSGTRIAAILLQLQKTTGIVQFNIRVGKNNGGGITLGMQPETVSGLNNRSTGPVDLAYITIAPPGSPVTFSAGSLSGLEGYESGTSWNNVSLFSTDIDYVETGNQTGVNAVYTKGPASLTLQFGDNGDTHVFNTLEGLGTYNFNSNNALNVFFTQSLGRTGVYAHTSTAGTSWSSSALGTNAITVNSNMYGAYYSWTKGNLNLVPEVQYVYAKVDHQVGINKFTSNLGVALFGDYSFANTPYSLGGWIAWEKSNGGVSGTTTPVTSTWFIGPNDESIALAISPTWQYKYLYVRANAGVIHLLNNKYSFNGTSYTYGFGRGNDKKTQLVAALETGFVF